MKVNIPNLLQSYTNNLKIVNVTGMTIEEVLNNSRPDGDAR